MAMANKRNLGQQLKQLRERLGESQEEFGRRFGLLQCTISRWEQRGIPDDGPTKLAARYILDALETAE
jgi:transcriptional regulator with XRE-family HTH domain